MGLNPGTESGTVVGGWTGHQPTKTTLSVLLSVLCAGEGAGRRRAAGASRGGELTLGKGAGCCLTSVSGGVGLVHPIRKGNGP